MWWRKNGAGMTPDEAPIAQLTGEDFAECTARQQALTEMARVYRMMEHGYQYYWLALKKKYGLPDDIQFDQDTGAVYAAAPSQETDDE